MISAFLVKKKYDDSNSNPYHRIMSVNLDRRLSLLRKFYFGKKENPFVIFGCSYAYGFGLNEDQTFSYKLHKQTGSTVLNYALYGEGVAFMYQLLSDSKILADLKRVNPSTIYYVYIPGHNERAYNFRNCGIGSDYFSIRYEIKNGVLQEDKISAVEAFFHSFYMAILLEDFISQIQKQYGNPEKVFSELLLNSYNIIKKELPNSKFVIILYPDGKEQCGQDNEALAESISFLTSVLPDVKILNVNNEINELDNSQYWLDFTEHPSEYAWDKLIPIILDKTR